jgi:uncharacterized NAD-dependent epimerase/dehydratase family protein
MCDHAAQTTIGGSRRPKPSLPDAIELYERMAALIHPCKVIGVGLNTHGLSDAAARDALARAEDQTALPAADVIRFGPEKLVEATLAARRPSDAGASPAPPSAAPPKPLRA